MRQDNPRVVQKPMTLKWCTKPKKRKQKGYHAPSSYLPPPSPPQQQKRYKPRPSGADPSTASYAKPAPSPSSSLPSYYSGGNRPYSFPSSSSSSKGSPKVYYKQISS